MANRNTSQDYKGDYLSFNLNLNLPPPCTTGFLPAQQQRAASFVDYPDRPAGDMYCRIPQDSAFNVRGARNLPCITVPGKRAPTVKLCESNQVYLPLNDGCNWKGDPNATLSGQPVPHVPPGSPPAQAAPPPGPAPPPIAAAEYDPASGTYVGPDGQVYTQANLARMPKKSKHGRRCCCPRRGTDRGDRTGVRGHRAQQPIRSRLTQTDDSASIADVEESRRETPPNPRRSRRCRTWGWRRAGLVVVLALGGLVGWLGLRAYHSHQAEQQRALFLQVGKQAAINLTTIDLEHADTDVQRILDSATGPSTTTSRSGRSRSSTSSSRRSRSRGHGDRSGCGVRDRRQAQVLVAVTVKTSNAGAPEQEPRAWRMRISVKKVDDDAKVSNVEFVP